MKKIILLFMVICLIVISCKKNDVSAPTPTPVYIPPPITTEGANYGGGIVFRTDGQHGYIAAPFDQSTGIKWYDGTNTQIFTGHDWYESIGHGKSNSNFIVNHYGPGNYAAYLCDTLSLNGYTDWFLPSRDELGEMKEFFYPGLSTDYYWSSTESGSVSAWATIPVGGYSTMNKTLLKYVRAIRSF